jgi:uncharacterized protein
MLGLDGFSALMREDTLIARSGDLAMYRRGGKVLFLEPRTAGWMVLDGGGLDLFRALTRPMLLGEFMRLPGEPSGRAREEFLVDFYTSSLVTLRGQAYCNPAALWKVPQKYPGFLCLHITEECNFACRYCLAESNPRKSKMAPETARAIIDRILADIPLNEITIDFHGGEPFMAFDAMMDAIAYAGRANEAFGKKLTFMVQTNGSLLTPERVRRLAEEKVVVGVSLDGPRHVQDKYRIFPGGSGTFDTVWDNVRRAEELGLRTGILSVIHDPEDYIETFNFLTSQGRTSFRMNYSSSIGRAKSELAFPWERADHFASEYLKMARLALAYARENGTALAISDLNNMINNLTSKSRPFMCYRSPCGIGSAILGFGIDGGVYACEEMASLGIFRIGSVFDGVPLPEMMEKSPVIADLMRRDVDNIPRCSRCALRRICTAGCTSKAYARFGDFLREAPMCRFYQIVLEELMWDLHENPDMAGLLNPEKSR